MSRFITPTPALLTGLAVTTPALLATPAHADQTPSPTSAVVTPADPAVNANETSVPSAVPSRDGNESQLPSTTPSPTDNNLNGNPTGPATTAINADGNQPVNPSDTTSFATNTNNPNETTGAVNNANNLNGNQTPTPTNSEMTNQPAPVTPVTATSPENPESNSTGAFNLPVVNLIQTPTPTVNDAVPDQTDAFLKAGSVSPSGGMDSNQIIKEAQDLGLNAVTVSLLTDFGDLHGSNPTIAQADWDKMAANVTALQAKGYKVIIQLYPVINNLRDVETAWAPSNKDQFFRQYDQLLERTAKFAEQNNVYGMYMATNLVQTEQYEDDWETAIQKVRALYHGQIFFRTNWWYYADWAPDTVTNYNNMLNRKFWKDVDVIAIASYFELTAKPNPTSEDLQKALYDVPYNNRHQNIVAQVQALHDKWHKPIFFGELGLAPHPLAASQPWSDHNASHTPSNDQIVANWFDAFYQVFSKYDWWKGYSIFTIDDPNSMYNPYGHSAGTTIKNQSIEETAAYKAAQPQTQDVSTTDPGAHTQVTRTIRVIDPRTQAAQTINQTVQFHRTATKNLRTGAVTYGAWQVSGNPQWAQYQVPTQAGYQPSIATVTAQTPTATTSPLAVTIIYQAQPQAVTVQLVDDSEHGKVIKTQTLTGVTDQNLLLPNLTPANYDLAPNQPTHYRLTAQADQTVSLHVTHRVLTRTETAQPRRVVQYQDPLTHQTKVIQTQVATISRSVTTDLVTNQVIQQRPWSTAHWDAVTAPVLAHDNHATNPNAAPAMTVTDPNTNLTVTFMYPMPTVTTTIRWVDDDAHQAVVKTQTVTGTVGQTTPLNLTAPDHYQVVGQLPTSYVPTANQTLTVHLAHQHHPTSQSRWVERVISYQDPHDHQTHKLVTQKISQTQSGDRDLVTNQTTWQPWPAVRFPAPDLPVITGYTADSVDPTATGPITVTYHANPSTSGADSHSSSTSVASSAGSTTSPSSSASSTTSVGASHASSTSVPGSNPSASSSTGEIISSAVTSSHASTTGSTSSVSSATSVGSSHGSSTSTPSSASSTTSSAVTSSSVSSTSVTSSHASANSSATSSSASASNSTGEVISSGITASSASSADSTDNAPSTSVNASNASSTSVTSSASSATSSTGEVISSAVTSSSASSTSSTVDSPAVSSTTEPGSSDTTASDHPSTSGASSTSVGSSYASSTDSTVTSSDASTTSSAVDSSAGEPISSAVVPSDGASKPSSTGASSSTEIDTSTSASTSSSASSSATSADSFNASAASGVREVISSAVKIATPTTPTTAVGGRVGVNPNATMSPSTPANPIATASNQVVNDRLPQTGNHLAQTATLLGVLGLSLAFSSLKKQRRN